MVFTNEKINYFATLKHLAVNYFWNFIPIVELRKRKLFILIRNLRSVLKKWIACNASNAI